MKLILIYAVLNSLSTGPDEVIAVQKHDFATPAACYAAAEVLNARKLAPSTFNNIVVRDVACI